MNTDLINHLVLLGVAIVSTGAVTLLNIKSNGLLKRFTYYGIWAGFALGLYAVALIAIAAS